MRLLIFLPLAIAIIVALSGCKATKGSIVIFENLKGTEISADFKEWSSYNRCELSLNKGDELHVEVIRESGDIDLTISGRNGSEPYSGNNLESCAFTVTVQETDEYVIQISGKNATGRITAKNLGRIDD